MTSVINGVAMTVKHTKVRISVINAEGESIIAGFDAASLARVPHTRSKGKTDVMIR
jgi:hypothetical protein